MSYLKQITAVAGLIFSSAALAAGQTGFTFDVPFHFSTPGARMPAGQYELARVNLLSNSLVYRLTNLETGRAVAVTAVRQASRTETAGATAEVEFRCAAERCALAGLYGPWRTTVIAFPASLQRAAPREEIALIRIPASD